MDFEELIGYERINVVGTAGSGKSTFARALAELLNIPYCEMDQLYWMSDWQGSSDAELFRQVREMTSQPKWVLDGNYTRTIPIKWDQVQLVIWIDLPFLRTVYRVSKRAIQRSFSRQELWTGTGNRESLSRAFLSRDSIIWWAMTSYRRNRQKYLAMMTSSDYSHIRFLRLRSPESVAGCLDGLRRLAGQTRVAEQTVHQTR